MYNFADCPLGYHGNNCSKCSDSCQTCDSVNGKCLSCVDPSSRGDYCNQPCQSTCSNTECDIKIGICSCCFPESINRQICENYRTNLSEQKCNCSCRQICTEINECNACLSVLKSFQASGSFLCNIECEGHSACIICATNKSDSASGWLQNDSLLIPKKRNILSAFRKCFAKNVTKYCKYRTFFATKDFDRRMPTSDGTSNNTTSTADPSKCPSDA